MAKNPTHIAIIHIIAIKKSLHIATIYLLKIKKSVCRAKTI